MNFQQTIIGGRLTRDPASKTLPSNTTLCEFGIACSRRYRTAAGEDREDVLFLDATAFGRTGEVIQEHCRKGSPLLCIGRLKLDTWDDRNGGGKRSKISLVVEEFQFVGPKAPGGADRQQHPPDDGDQRRQPVGPARRQAAQQPRGRQPMQYDEQVNREARERF